MKTSWNHFDISLRYYTVILAEIIFENVVRLSRDGIKMPVAGRIARVFQRSWRSSRSARRNWFLDFVEREAGMTLHVVTLWHEHASTEGHGRPEWSLGTVVGATKGTGSMHNDGGTRARNERFIKINWRSGTFVGWAPAIKHYTYKFANSLRRNFPRESRKLRKYNRLRMIFVSKANNLHTIRKVVLAEIVQRFLSEITPLVEAYDI